MKTFVFVRLLCKLAGPSHRESSVCENYTQEIFNSFYFMPLDMFQPLPKCVLCLKKYLKIILVLGRFFSMNNCYLLLSPFEEATSTHVRT